MFTKARLQTVGLTLLVLAAINTLSVAAPVKRLVNGQ